MKICKYCDEIKDVDSFVKGRNKCKICAKKWRAQNRSKNIERDKSRSLKWYYKNKEKALVQNRNWVKNNPEKIKAITKRTTEKNKEKILQRSAEYRKKNSVEINIKNKVSTKKWRNKNKEAFAEMSKNWRNNNLERMKELCKRWDKLNPEKRAAFRKNANAKRRSQRSTGKISSDEWEKLKEKAGNICHYCKKKKYLTQDHVIPLSKGGLHHISNIVPACQSCNSSKGNKIITLL